MSNQETYSLSLGLMAIVTSTSCGKVIDFEKLPRDGCIGATKIYQNISP